MSAKDALNSVLEKLPEKAAPLIYKYAYEVCAFLTMPVQSFSAPMHLVICGNGFKITITRTPSSPDEVRIACESDTEEGESIYVKLGEADEAIARLTAATAILQQAVKGERLRAPPEILSQVVEALLRRVAA